MKSLILLILLAICSHYKQFDEEWKLYKRSYGKVYSGPEEEASHRLLWQKRVHDVSRHNLLADMGLESYRRSINVFSDIVLHFDRIPLKRGNISMGEHSTAAELLPPDVDWRKKGAVTSVKDQGQCGTVWAFSAVGALEGMNQIKTGKLVDLSVQNLVDCVPSQGGSGCVGGLAGMDDAFEYVKRNNGIDTEAAYPATGKGAGKCQFDPKGVGATCSGYVDIPTGDELALQKAVATAGPVSTAIQASREGFLSYRNGVYDDPGCSSYQLDHAVLIVGYGSEDGKDYWIVKNSWGATWGEDGYIKMRRNSKNQCGIATMASYPLP